MKNVQVTGKTEPVEQIVQRVLVIAELLIQKPEPSNPVGVGTTSEATEPQNTPQKQQG